MQTTTWIPIETYDYFLAHLQYSLKFAWKSFGWYLHQVDKLTSKKYAKAINLLCAGNKVFVTYQTAGAGLTSTSPCVRP